MSQGCGWGRAAHFTPAPAVPVPTRAGVDPRDRVVEAARALRAFEENIGTSTVLAGGFRRELDDALDALDGKDLPSTPKCPRCPEDPRHDLAPCSRRPLDDESAA